MRFVRTAVHSVKPENIVTFLGRKLNGNYADEIGNDFDLFRAIIQGEFNISGFQNRNLCRYLSGKSAHQVSRLLKRLRKHGLIKKIANSYKYYLTVLGRKVTVTALKLREMFIIPSLRIPTVG